VGVVQANLGLSDKVLCAILLPKDVVMTDRIVRYKSYSVFESAKHKNLSQIYEFRCDSEC
jgi:hypothetical protein